MKARLNTDKVLHFLDTGLEVGVEAFTARIVDSEGVDVITLTMSSVAAVPSFYVSPAYTPDTVGSFDIFFEYDGSVIYRDTLDVGQPLSDAPLGESVIESLSSQEAGGSDKVVTLYALDSSGASLVEEGGEDPINAAFSADYNAYTAGITFESEGDYFLVWYVDDTPVSANNVFALKPYGLESIRFFCATLQGNNGTPHSETTLVVSSSSGDQIATGSTDNSGLLDMKVSPGEYVVTLLKSGVAYSINNFSITVGDSITEGLGPRQSFHLITGSFTPTTSDPQLEAEMCTIFASIYKMDGTPLTHAPIHVRMLTKPQLYSGSTVYDSQLTFSTDSNGKASFRLIQGIEVEVGIPPMGLRRIIKVPSGADAAEPVNLFTLLSDAKDLFDIQKPQIQTAPRRTR